MRNTAVWKELSFSWPAAVLAIGLLGCGSRPAADHANATGDSGLTPDVGSAQVGTCRGGDPAILGSAPGCDEGTACTPASDLIPPPADTGFPIATPDVTLQPGQESYFCYFKTLPGNADIDIGTIQSWMTPASSHELIAFAIAPGGQLGPDDTLGDCHGMTAGSRIHSASLSGAIVETKMPEHVGLHMSAGTQVMLEMHFRNPGSATLAAHVKMNLLFANDVQYRAGSLLSFNVGINVPPAGPDGLPGAQTVKGKCTAPAGSNVFLVTTKTYGHATLAEVDYVSGGQSQTIVRSTDWEHPGARVWGSPCFLTLKSGDAISYSCSYTNSGSTPIVVGDFEATNDVCMAIAYYFPAGNGECF
jgi:hypothetical protein